MPSNQLDLNCVTIGVLTALEEEYAACKAVFDPNQDGEDHHRRATSGEFACWLCPVPARRGEGRHVVAITLLPDMGNNAAAIAANILLQHCPDVRYLIMCGIAGAVPNPEECNEHVRLGDIVVSNSDGIVQYDRGKQRDPRRSKSEGPDTADSPLDPLAGFELRSPCRPPSPDLLAAVQRMHVDEHLLAPDEYREWEVKIEAFLASCGDQQKWKRPHYNQDRLIDSPDGTGPSTKHPKDRARRKIGDMRCPRVFRGPIGAANIVLADPLRRDALRDRDSVKAVEMETSGVADASWVAGVGYLAVRGTCDYCNSTKADGWHEYAALIAAAYARTVVEYLHPIGVAAAIPVANEPPFAAPQSPASVPSSHKKEWEVERERDGAELDRRSDPERDRDTHAVGLPAEIDANEYDVFLCHNTADKPAVIKIGEHLKKRGVLPWLDQWNLVPGRPWQDGLEECIEEIKSVAIFVGPDGIGPWQNDELKAFLREFVKRGCPVIPVILPACSRKPEIPMFLRSFTWVDFREDESDAFDQLVWGITGVKPSPTQSGCHLGHDTTPTSHELSQSIAADTQAQLLAAQAIGKLVAAIDGLVEEYRWAEIDPFAIELEKQLRLLPRKGAQVRQGWMLLARCEIHKQTEAKRAGRVTDPNRLRILREEAENVID